MWDIPSHSNLTFGLTRPKHRFPLVWRLFLVVLGPNTSLLVVVLNQQGFLCSILQIFDSNHHAFVRNGEGEQLVSACVGHTMKQAGVMVRGVLLVTLLVIYVEVRGTDNQHGSCWILQWNATPSGLHLEGPSLVAQQDNEPKHISRLCPKPNINPS